MITTKTVLVLGAGASADYGFPTGGLLVTQITNDFKGNTSRVQEIMPHEYHRFVELISRNQPSSIDEFLESHPSLENIGKQAIAMHLLPFEGNSKHPLTDLNKKNHWYRYLKTQIACPFECFGDNQLRIITFNYDRSLEYYLYETLRASDERITDEECAEMLRQLPLLHVYGSLGPLPWQAAEGAMPYGGNGVDVFAVDIQTAGKNIQVLHEGMDSTARQYFQTAQEWLSWANKIVFLGFGFHPDNRDRLGLALNDTLRKRRKRIFAAGRGLGQRIRELDPYITFADRDADCYTLLYDYVGLL